ncbi:DUF4190 domain-containing protein [Streptomyces sp. NPDC005900]|uniref:DUF4190 domain-containing protein n=1 Tax=unclassified Streptomyces TaxID=2593676 RepID=UPI003407EACB
MPGARPHAADAHPFAVPGEPVPPPPISPDGPGQPQPQSPYGYPGPGGYPVGQGGPGYGWPGMPGAPANGMGVAALVLGVIATVVFFLGPLPIVLGVLAVIFGAVGRGRARRGEATNGGQALAGIICGAVGIVLGVALLVVLLVVPDEDMDAGRSAMSATTAESVAGSSP